MEESKNWRFCAVGNIFYGTKAFTPGTKVYLYDNYWVPDDQEITVIGLNRFGRYAYERIPVDRVINVRYQRVFKPKVLQIIDYEEHMEGAEWHTRTADDKRALKKFVDTWNESYQKSNNNQV